MSREVLKKKILELLSKGDMTSTQLRDELINEGINLIEFRSALAELVREGVVEKYPVYEEKKFYFRLKNA
ncbi:hypothetical protein BFU36_03515 [Sulfolobus sp. A20]|uniref:hypothetical protein n=1 Tax=Sulfolobaceae TaxID=118883 RepID=UPI0008460C57|nr:MULTISPECIES: hypothetical protein [unclassified Sulfolobus]TRM75017.1 hypothetical protein DJ523_03630 [Sulfolobus sp. E5]TRM78528.1 hypothetical protein DJ532_00620 [Sulfolobus sp. A20-N-F8]TRM79257.1 hypothetical protein DJ528_01975 [Sulfolobus sp. B5]TRM80754.1 hypothetical protein DJ524_06500 [Sulfolobus sp. D5]TRM84426.1 hypothetical protein DJ522_04800 [Sulfolobus sp. F3]TRM88215.1 hypothetical protein DJ521_02285 [Sulfolobus sp. E3]TRM89839.1 hypothetical protein DJ529_00180 [Sulf